MDRRILFSVAGLLLIVGGIFLYKKMGAKKKSNDLAQVTFVLSSQEINVGSSIQYEDKTPGAKTWEWDFGDGETSSQQKGSHEYTQDGDYTVKLIVNGALVSTMQVRVKALVPVDQPANVPLAALAGPVAAKVGDKVTFTDNTPGATSTKWKFGESGMEDGTGKTFTYVYNRPGTYDVVATNDVSKTPGRRRIVIKPNIPVVVPKPGPDKGKDKLVPVPAVPAIDNNALMAKLQQFSNSGFEFNSYSGLLKYFCGRDDIPVYYNGKSKDFNSYCKRLDFVKPKITKLTQNKDPQTNCVNSITIEEQ